MFFTEGTGREREHVLTLILTEIDADSDSPERSLKYCDFLLPQRQPVASLSESRYFPCIDLQDVT